MWKKQSNHFNRSIIFAKSPRSCMIDPGEPFYITPGRNIDSEGELAIIIGKPAYNVSLEQAHGYVFGYSIAKNLIFDEALMLRYRTSIRRLYPGDVIVTGTPDGVGAARKPPEFLKPGDEVTIEIEGIGALKTPMRAATRANQ